MTLVRDEGFSADADPVDVVVDPADVTEESFGALLAHGSIGVIFPMFQDGRGFSIARDLRSRGYTGRLRAIGPLIADQYAFIRACGFDEVEIPDELAARQPEASWQRSAGRISRYYQRGIDGVVAIPDARAARLGAPNTPSV